MLRGLILSAFLLSGCSGPSLSDNQRAEVRNIAEDFADSASGNTNTSSLEERIEKLESRATQSDEAHNMHFKNIGRLSKDGVTDANNIAKLSQDLIEHERLYHGR